jgi:hypothetical protein
MSLRPINRQMLINALTRDMSALNSWFGSDTKHPHFYADYGFPLTLRFENFMNAYKRSGLGKAGVNRAIETCWQSNPVLQVKKETHDETLLEKQIAEAFDRLAFWMQLKEADRYSRIGEYGALIFRYRDNQALDQPVKRVGGGLEGVAEIIPVHQDQLKPATFHSDPSKENYGHVAMWQFNEQSIVDQNTTSKVRQFNVHPDRVHVWSANGTIWNEPVLESGFNDLLTIQKINGAGGEGFWKMAKQAPILNVAADAKLSQLATMLGVPLDELPDKLDTIVDDYNRGLDSTMVLQGIEAKVPQVSMPSPEHFLAGPLQSFAASLSIPLKILVGNQNGERASTEDMRSWNATCNSRRTQLIIPNVLRILRKWEQYAIIPANPWYLLWSDLTESTSAEKAELASKMATATKTMAGTGQENPTFTNDEIREVMGYQPLEPEQIPKPDENAPDEPESNPTD